MTHREIIAEQAKELAMLRKVLLRCLFTLRRLLGEGGAK